MTTIAILSTLVLYLAAARFGDTADVVTCRICNDVEHLEDCTGSRSCVTGELGGWEVTTLPSECFMEQKVTGDLRFIYRGGCRSTQVCRDAAGSSVGKRENGVVACSRCCNTALCNDKLCGIPRVLRNTRRQLREKDTVTSFHTTSANANLTSCFSCGGENGRVPAVRHPEDCSETTLCQSNEMCFTSMAANDNEQLIHLTKCAPKELCLPLMTAIFGLPEDVSSLVGKRATQGCAACCNDDNCNRYACTRVREKMVRLNKLGLVDPNTLKLRSHA